MGLRKRPGKRSSKGTSKRTSAKPLSPKRKAFLQRQANDAYLRRVKFALSRSKPLPDPANKTQAKLRDKESIEFLERNPPEVREKRRKKSQYYRDRKKAEKEYGADSRHKKFGRVNDRVYNIPFKKHREEIEEGEFEFSLSVDVDAMRSVFALEAKQDVENKPRVVRGFMKVRFKDEKVIWYALKYPRLASDGPGEMIDDMEVFAASYAVKNVLRIEVVVSYME